MLQSHTRSLGLQYGIKLFFSSKYFLVKNEIAGGGGEEEGEGSHSLSPMTAETAPVRPVRPGTIDVRITKNNSDSPVSERASPMTCQSI